MANNLSVLDSAGATKSVKSTDNAGVHTPHHNIDAIAAGANIIGQVGIDQTTPGTTNKVSIGSDGKVGVQQGGSDISSSNPLNVVRPDGTATGTITTQNLVPAGTATANSAVEIAVADKTIVAIQVTGTFTGALSVQGTVDGTNWVTFGGTPIINVNSAAMSATISSAATGIYTVDCAGMQKVRVTGLSAMTGTATVTLRASAGVGQVAIDAMMPAVAANSSGALNANVAPIPSINAVNSSTHKLISAASTNATSVKSSTAVVVGGSASNLSASTKYLKFYKKASAPTVGTDVPVYTLPIPAGVTLNLGEFFGAMNVPHGTGLAYAITGAAADNDTTAVAAGDVIVNLIYV